MFYTVEPERSYFIYGPAPWSINDIYRPGRICEKYIFLDIENGIDIIVEKSLDKRLDQRVIFCQIRKGVPTLQNVKRKKHFF